ncbi:MAG TPA: dihydroorotate dehydrogenase [Bacteroidales bacterium]|nr:dihydroorotate dehydrogenase [Bacteroidales bacterium]HOH23010.1 dihydroorotate dehydrogenase [Bacteroidales bacterium]HPZ03631.1 dihydroorotate dehydrogenase [Bacteroidales bacterium]HQB75232.1 dihydroorotate dehydrogenase [Bacteroidales bacterium]
MKNKLETIINGVKFKNPIIAASGCYGFGREYNELYDISLLGGISSKGLTLEPRQGNKGIRIWETASGMMNSVGLQNPGVHRFIEEELPWMRKHDTVIIANLGGSLIEDYIEGINLLNKTEVDMIELNISCPNVKTGGMALGIKADIAFEAVKLCKQASEKPLMVKLSPNAENIIEMAQACEAAGADSLSLVNTFNAMAVDVRNKKAVFNNTYAGLSGAAIKPIALRMVHQVCKNVKIPVVGLGGIYTLEDILSFIMVGATAVQVGTANFNEPNILPTLIQQLEQYCEEEKLNHISDIQGII